VGAAAAAAGTVAAVVATAAGAAAAAATGTDLHERIDSSSAPVLRIPGRFSAP
jgi:hypothetical protein